MGGHHPVHPGLLKPKSRLGCLLLTTLMPLPQPSLPTLTLARPACRPPCSSCFDPLCVSCSSLYPSICSKCQPSVGSLGTASFFTVYRSTTGACLPCKEKNCSMCRSNGACARCNVGFKSNGRGGCIRICSSKLCLSCETSTDGRKCDKCAATVGQIGMPDFVSVYMTPQGQCQKASKWAGHGWASQPASQLRAPCSIGCPCTATDACLPACLLPAEQAN